MVVGNKVLVEGLVKAVCLMVLQTSTKEQNRKPLQTFTTSVSFVYSCCKVLIINHVCVIIK